MQNADDFASVLLEEARKLREQEEQARNEVSRIAQEIAQLQEEQRRNQQKLDELRNKPLP